MPTFKLVITSSGINSTTGHHTIQCHVKETQDDGTVVRGIPETFGIEAVAMERKHNNNPEDWRKWVEQLMLTRHKQRSLAHAEIVEWHGKEFDIEPS